MTVNRWGAAILLWLAFALTGGAQEQPEAPETPEAPPAGNEAPESPPPAAEEPRTLEEIFIPSEEIGADEEVTFPINI